MNILSNGQLISQNTYRKYAGAKKEAEVRELSMEATAWVYKVRADTEKHR